MCLSGSPSASLVSSPPPLVVPLAGGQPASSGVRKYFDVGIQI